MKQFVKKYRETAGLTQQQLSDATGIPLKTIQDWEQTGRSPRDMQRLVPVADVLDCSTDDLLGRILPKGAIRAVPTETVMVPLYGTIAAGEAIEMIEDYDEYPMFKEVADKYPDAFLLKVKGESMNRVLPSCTYAFINPTNEVLDNKVYALNVNGYDATIKRVRQLNNGFELIPDSTDPTFESKIYDYGKPGTEQVRIIGRVVYHIVPFDYEY